MVVRRPTSERGSAMTVALLATFVIVGMGVSMLLVSTATQREHLAGVQRTNRRYLAQAGVTEALLNMVQGGTGNLGSQGTPVKWGPGGFRTVVADTGNRTYTITSFGRSGTSSRAVRAVTRETTKSVFHHAMYAGNSSKDPTYVLQLAGTGAAADVVDGDIYSGGGISIGGNASVTGVLRATGDITGGTGEEGVEATPPDLAAMNYASNHDINVAAQFAAAGYSASHSGLGGTAYQVPEANPAHIFRLNPSDRATDTATTVKNDYFLEDPYESVSTSTSINADNATRISIAGTNGEPGPDSNRKVYYIDGNLWIHNRQFYSVVFQHANPAGLQVTFVVKGNIYISDNILLRNKVKDGVALIAIKDPAVANSGNVYFGDPVFGTLERMEAFMYAENNFHDNVLSQSGSAVIEVMGMMSAGNQVRIDRNSATIRPKLDLEFDTRIRDGSLVMPGIPDQGVGNTRRSFEVLAEFEVPAGE